MSISEDIPLALPAMRNNPFPLRPLSKDDYRLLIGRDDITQRAHGWLTARSARMVLLVGERGSGRTSLLNVLGGLASSHHYFSIYPTQDTVRSLLEELYISVVGDFEVPPTLSQLRNTLVESLDARSGKLPLLSFDYSNLAGSSITEMFKQISQVLRVMDAVSILSLTPAQLNAMPQELIDEFDEVLQLTPLSNKEMAEMISLRVSSVTREEWSADSTLIDELEEQTGGHASRVMRLMRDVVHSTKLSGGIDPRINDMFLSMKARKELMLEEEHAADEPGQEEELHDQDIAADQSIEDEPETSAELNFEQDDSDDEYSEHFEQVTPEIESPPEEVQHHQAPVRAGAFGRLGSRTHMTNSSMRSEGIPVTPADFHEVKLAAAPPIASPSLEAAVYESEDAALWTEDGVAPPIPIQPAPPSTSLPLQPMTGAVDQSDFLPMSVETGLSSESVFNQLSGSEPLQASHQVPIPRASFSAALQQFRPVQGIPVDDHALEIDRMRSLDDREVKVIMLLSQRECSPSDTELTSLLGGVTRSRLSQICNGLHKVGILSVRRQGRSRVFRVSSSARAQLVAWGMLR